MITALTNTSALAARHSLLSNQRSLGRVTEQLSTGFRINRGADDPAGLIVSEHLRAELRSLQTQNSSLERAYANANISDGHASQLGSLFSELNSLVVASANDAGMTDAERGANQLQIDSIVSSIQKFSGDAVASLDHVSLPDGGNAVAVDALNSAAAAAATVASGGANDLASGNLEVAQQAVSQAATSVAQARGRVGAYQRNTVEPRIRSNQIAIENIAASNSVIRDTDFAEATSRRTQSAVLTEANIRVLKIAQQQSASVLSLLAR